MKPIRVISRYPKSVELKDGMMQRVLDIDDLLSTEFVLEYIHLSFTKNLRFRKLEVPSHNNRRIVTEYKLNAILHIFLLVKLLNESCLVLCHSVMNFVYINLSYIFISTPLVSDIHGAVPEEHIVMQKKLHSRIYLYLESKMFRNSTLVLAVSRSMQSFYSKKYKFLSEDQVIFVPIQSEIADVYAFNRKISRNIGVIYAGGVQAWQNVDLMLSTSLLIKKYNPEWKVSLFFPDQFLELVRNTPIQHAAKIGTANKTELEALYHQSHLGFLLRDDTIVNRVSSPTKLSEYLSFGIIPIVIQPNVGDLEIRGYKYILLDEISRANFLSADYLHEMRVHNMDLYVKNHNYDSASRSQLVKIIRNMINSKANNRVHESHD
ncbi:hypothetical protein ACI3L1_08745 [Deinococcus sp. SM5_A1]|uniref:hypothetical protein n=1 Tax=Deinococcus sp. SM5_A1 TaxID=3379094 RepID=UPI003859FFAC